MVTLITNYLEKKIALKSFIAFDQEIQFLGLYPIEIIRNVV